MKIQVFWSTMPWFRVTDFSEELVTSEMSVLICHSTLRHIPGDPSLRQHRTENLSNYQSVERLLFLTTITSRFFSDFFLSRTFECGDGPSGFTEERNFFDF